MPPELLAETYQIKGQIGSGGGGIVYLAWHLRLDKPVVLKEDRRGLSANMEKLRREADALKSLNHTYIPQVYDFVIDQGKVYTVMEFIEGESFDRLLKREETFEPAMVVKWTRQLLEALCYLHSRPPYGLIHGDIKPANVMLTPSGDIRLIDFNIALALNAQGAVAIGASEGYASPEHYGSETLYEATGRKTVPSDPNETQPMVPEGVLSTSRISHRRLLDARSDIYSLGAMIYHLLSGLRPPPKAWNLNPLSSEQYGPALVSVLSKSMAPDPEQRYQTAQQMLDAILRLHQDDPRYRKILLQQKIAGIFFSALFLVSGFCGFVGLKRMQQESYVAKQVQASILALSQGKGPEAVALALEALSKKSDLFTPPPTPEAQHALATALGIYDLSDGYRICQAVSLPTAPFRTEISPKATVAAAVYAYQVALINPQSSQIIATLPTEKSALSEARFIGENQLVYAGPGGVCSYDIAQQREQWKGQPATAVAVSADQTIIATINRDAKEAILYTTAGKEKISVAFGEKHQRIPADDTFGDPGGRVFALNQDGSRLAVSFSDGSLSLFSTADGTATELLPPGDAVQFEGGFFGKYFAFSAAPVEKKYIFAVVDATEMKQTGGFQSTNHFGVIANEQGIFVSSENLVVRFDPETGEQQELAYTEADITGFAQSAQAVAAVTSDKKLNIFDPYANRVAELPIKNSFDFLSVADTTVMAGGRNQPKLTICRQIDLSDSEVLRYDPGYIHNEARVNQAQDHVMLFSYQGFRIYSTSGTLVCDVSIPNSERVYDQQYSPASGNLAVMYPDSLRIYSGHDGSLIFEETGLQSVFYAKYGISILRQDGTLLLVDSDSAQASLIGSANGEFAAFCGMVVDDGVLQGKKLIGATRFDNGYRFAVSGSKNGEVLDESGKALFEFEASGECEAFFTPTLLLVSPRHADAIAYDLKSGKRLNSWSSPLPLTYLTQVEDWIISESVTTKGERTGMLRTPSGELLATLPSLCDIDDRMLFFDYQQTGSIRKGTILTLDHLKQTEWRGDCL